MALRPGITQPRVNMQQIDNPTEENLSTPQEEQNRRNAMVNGVDYGGFQSVIGRYTPQPLKGGTQTNAPLENFPTVTPGPAPVTPTTPLPYDKYNPATWWWRQTPSPSGFVNGYNTNAIPGGRHNGGPTVPTFYNERTGLHQYGPGNGWSAAPQSSPYAFQRNPRQFGFQSRDMRIPNRFAGRETRDPNEFG